MEQGKASSNFKNTNLPSHINYWCSEANPDCFFLVGPESGPVELIGALKVFLMGHSESFRSMLSDDEIGEIRIFDVEPEIFKCFLKCLYGGSDIIISQLPFESWMKLLCVAEKYRVVDLKHKLVCYLALYLSPKTVCHFLKHSVWLGSDILKRKILTVLRDGFEIITMDKHFWEINSKSLLWMLQQTDFGVKEVQIWEIVLKWAIHQTKSSDVKVLRSLILPFLKHIRFLSMDFKEFCHDVVPKNVLSKEEVYEICISFGTVTRPLNLPHLCELRNSRNSEKQPEKMPINYFNHSGHAVVLLSANATDLDEMLVSNSFTHDGCSWCIEACKKTNEHKKNIQHLVLFLKCELRSTFFKYFVKSEFSLLHDEDESFKKYFEHTFNENSNVFYVMFPWHKINSGGYIKGGKFRILLTFAGLGRPYVQK